LLLSEVSDNFIVDLTFLRTLPNSLRAILIGSIGQDRAPVNSWDFGFSLTSALGDRRKTTTEDDILRDFYHSLNLFTIGIYKEMLMNEVNRPAAGQFVFFHAMVPHSPWARDESCDFIPKDLRTEANKKARARGQHICALKILSWLIDHLKQLGRYEDALIIVHADHGIVRPPPDTPGLDLNAISPSEWPNWAVESTAAGLLVIKWPHATGRPRSAAPAQTGDIAPTVLRHFGIAVPEHYVGTALQELSEDSTRAMTFFAMQKPTVGDTAEVISRYSRQGDGEWQHEEDIPTNP